MRLFPRDYTGLHPAFPDRPDPEFTPSAFAAGIIETGKWTVAPLLLSFIIPTYKARVQSFALKAAAYGSPALVGIAAADDSIRARPFLLRQGVALPERRYIDRVGHFDLDDAVILGGICGSVVATAARTPGLVGGWRRGLGAFVFGGSAGFLGCVAYKLLRQTDIQDFYRRAEAAQASSKHWRPIIRADSSSTKSPAVAPTDILATTRTWGSSQGSGGGSSSGSSGPGAVAAIPQLGNQAEVIADGPHLAQKIPDSPEPIVIANTNYKWTSPNPIADLEAHLQKLQERRAQLATEAELMWSWLSEKEAEYYNSPISKLDDKSPEKLQKLRYLETLGSAHTKIWQQATACDWMIADSKKRIAQLQSAEQNNGTVTYRAAAAVNNSDLQYSLILLKTHERGLQQAKEQILQAKSQLATNLIGDIDPDAGDQQVYHPVLKKMVTQREMLTDIKEKLEESLAEIEREESVMKEILDDAMKRRVWK